mgnify:CR=1 FL=1
MDSRKDSDGKLFKLYSRKYMGIELFLSNWSKGDMYSLMVDISERAVNVLTDTAECSFFINGKHEIAVLVFFALFGSLSFATNAIMVSYLI